MRTRATNLIVAIVLAVTGVIAVSSCSTVDEAAFRDGYKIGYKAVSGQDPW